MQHYDILLIDDHAMFRTGLSMVLQAGIDSVRVAEAESLAETLDQAAPPDLILLDIQLPGLNGLDAITSLKHRWPNATIIVLSAFHTGSNVNLAYERGASAFVSKKETTANIISVIEKVRHGHTNASDSPAASNDRNDRPHLTPRQCDILDLLSQGHSNKVIAYKLDLSEYTVRWHVQSLLKLLQATSRSEAIFIARTKGLVD